MQIKRQLIAAARFMNEPWMWIGLSFVILFIDFFTGPFFQFPATFIIPVALAAWNRGKKWSLPFAIMLPLVRFSYFFAWEVPWTIFEASVNLVIRITVLGSFALLISTVAKNYRELEREVKLLEGILPICGFCKSIRDEKGNWHRLENYISSKTEAKFSHSFCPECGKKHYGDYLAGGSLGSTRLPTE